MTLTSAQLIDEVRRALRVVIDPELGYNVVDLGFIYGVVVEEGVARITMTATTPGCPAVVFLKRGIAAAAATVPGVTTTEVTVTFDPPWMPSMMSSDAKSALGFAEVH